MFNNQNNCWNIDLILFFSILLEILRFSMIQYEFMYLPGLKMRTSIVSIR